MYTMEKKLFPSLMYIVYANPLTNIPFYTHISSYMIWKNPVPRSNNPFHLKLGCMMCILVERERLVRQQHDEDACPNGWKWGKYDILE